MLKCNSALRDFVQATNCVEEQDIVSINLIDLFDQVYQVNVELDQGWSPATEFFIQEKNGSFFYVEPVVTMKKIWVKSHEKRGRIFN